jgi:hypothetical protein
MALARRQSGTPPLKRRSAQYSPGTALVAAPAEVRAAIKTTRSCCAVTGLPLAGPSQLGRPAPSSVQAACPSARSRAGRARPHALRPRCSDLHRGGPKGAAVARRLPGPSDSRSTVRTTDRGRGAGHGREPSPNQPVEPAIFDVGRLHAQRCPVPPAFSTLGQGPLGSQGEDVRGCAVLEHARGGGLRIRPYAR